MLFRGSLQTRQIAMGEIIILIPITHNIDCDNLLLFSLFWMIAFINPNSRLSVVF